jgi:hypothetical protein
MVDEPNEHEIDLDDDTEIVSAEVALAALPEGAPSQREGYRDVKQRLTKDDKILIKFLRTLAFEVATDHNGLYTVEGLRAKLELAQRGAGTAWLFRFVVVHNHRLKLSGESRLRWRRLHPAHRSNEGKKCEVYKLVESEERFDSVACSCAWCEQMHSASCSA